MRWNVRIFFYDYDLVIARRPQFRIVRIKIAICRKIFVIKWTSDPPFVVSEKPSLGLDLNGKTAFAVRPRIEQSQQPKVIALFP